MSLIAIRNVFILLILIHCCQTIKAQPSGTVSGRIVNENDDPISNVFIGILNKSVQVTSNDSGYFSISLQANKPVALVFSYTGLQTAQRNFMLSANEEEFITVKMLPDLRQLDEVIVKDEREREQTGLINLDPSLALLNPSPVGGIESLIKVYVGSNNELTSQYNVRGGSYDENLVYVNDFEVYRPYLTRSGQQEGLSFINPELTGNVKFFIGGFQAKYGDKLSSVLDITYRKPEKFSGSAYIGLLEQGVHVEGISKNKKITWLAGARNRSNRNLLSSQETTGNYIPSAGDLQGLLTWQISKKVRAEFLGNFSQSKFTFYPQQSQLTSAVFSPLFSSNIGLDIFFEGQEKDSYNTNFAGLSIIHQPNAQLQSKWMLSFFSDKEQENIDITGAYLFGERNIDKNSADFGTILQPPGAGINQNYVRNNLHIEIFTFSHKLHYKAGLHFLQMGNSLEMQRIDDRLLEWEYRDSAGYSLPYEPGQLMLYYANNARNQIDGTRLSGYLQDNLQFSGLGRITLQGGLRYNYNTLNNEFLVSPRFGFSFTPVNWKKDIIFKGLAGMYVQPPFYREMRQTGL